MTEPTEITTGEVQSDQPTAEKKEYPSEEEFYNELKYYADGIVEKGRKGEDGYGINQQEDYFQVYTTKEGKRYYLCLIVNNPERPYYRCQFYKNKITPEINSPQGLSNRHDYITIRSNKPNGAYSIDLGNTPIDAASSFFGMNYGQYADSYERIVDYWRKYKGSPFQWIKDDVGPYRPHSTPLQRPIEPPRS